jgi:hypothetical protein
MLSLLPPSPPFAGLRIGALRQAAALLLLRRHHHSVELAQSQVKRLLARTASAPCLRCPLRSLLHFCAFYSRCVCSWDPCGLYESPAEGLLLALEFSVFVYI